MEKIKHKSLPFEKTIEVKRILGKKVNRSKQTNTLMSITIDAPDMKEELVITPDYIIAVGEGVMLKEVL
jgi:hypothetical protein